MVIIGQVGESAYFEDFYEVNFKEERRPEWNMQVGASCFAIITSREHEFTNLNYGLVPFWSTKKELFHSAPIDGGRAISEGEEIKPRIIQTPAFRKPIRDTRCIVPADYFILQGDGAAYLFFNQDRTPLSIGGVYDSWKAEIKEKTLYNGFAVLTMPAYGIFSELGIKRVPYIIPGNQYRKFIKEKSQLLDITQMFSIYPEANLNGYEVDMGLIESGLNSRDISKPAGEFFKPIKNKGGLSTLLRKNKTRKGATYDLDGREPKMWRE